MSRYIITHSSFKGGRFQVRLYDPAHEYGGEIVASAKTRIGAERKLKAILAANAADASVPTHSEPYSVDVI